MLLSFTLERKKQIPDVPTLLELAPPDKRDIVEFLAAGTPFGRAMAVGPGVSADRVAVLRKAFDDVMKDPAFLADAKKRNIDIDPRNAAYAHALVNKITSAPARPGDAREEGDRPGGVAALRHRRVRCSVVSGR